MAYLQPYHRFVPSLLYLHSFMLSSLPRQVFVRNTRDVLTLSVSEPVYVLGSVDRMVAFQFVPKRMALMSMLNDAFIQYLTNTTCGYYSQKLVQVCLFLYLLLIFLCFVIFFFFLNFFPFSFCFHISLILLCRQCRMRSLRQPSA